MYSRYEGRGNGSSVYMVKTGVRRVLTNYPDCYDYTSGITGDDTSDHITYEPAAEALAEMKLTPYKGLSSETIIRYLYTGREYNIETGDYYYRYRMMEAGIGRFTSKDLVEYSNLYIYATNLPIIFIDSNGTAYFAKIGLFEGRYDLAHEGSWADNANLQLVHEGIIWETGDITGFNISGYGIYGENAPFGSGVESRYTQIEVYYDDNLLQQAVDIVNETIAAAYGYNLLTFNCQHWSQMVREVYDILAGGDE